MTEWTRCDAKRAARVTFAAVAAVHRPSRHTLFRTCAGSSAVAPTRSSNSGKTEFDIFGSHQAHITDDCIALEQHPQPASKRPGRTPGYGRVQHLSATLGITQHSARSLHPRISNIKSLTNEDITQKCEVLEDVLQLPRAKLAALVIKEPEILWAPTEHLLSNLACIAQELQVDHAAVQHIICAHPHLLIGPTPAVREQMRGFLGKLGPDDAPQTLLQNYSQFVGRHKQAAVSSSDSAWLSRFVTVFGISDAAALEILHKAPNLVAICPVTLKDKLAFFSTLLSLPPSAIISLVCKRSALLRIPTNHVAATLAALTTTLSLPSPAVVATILRLPSLLILPAEDVLAKQANLRDSLGLSAAQAQKLVAKVPLLLLYSQANISRKVASLATTLRAPPARIGDLVRRDPSLLTVGHSHLPERLADLSAALQVPLDDVRQLVAKQPIILTRIQSGDVLLQRLDTVALSLGVPVPTARALVLRNCTLLLNNPKTLACKMAGLHRDLSLAPEVVVGLVAASPSILNYKTQVLSARWQRLQQHGQGFERWGGQLAGYRPSTLALMLTKRDAVYGRLDYVAEQGLQGRVALSTVLIYPLSKFVTIFPEYTAWDGCEEGEAAA